LQKSAIFANALKTRNKLHYKMKIIHKNPYRIAGILSNATERELQKQKTRIKAFAKVGKEIKSDYDFQILESIFRTEDSVNKAFSSIEQNQDKINYAFFGLLMQVLLTIRQLNI